MSMDGDCPFCGGHSTSEEWDAWNGECQWCGELDVEWKKQEDTEDTDCPEDDDDDF